MGNESLEIPWSVFGLNSDSAAGAEMLLLNVDAANGSDREHCIAKRKFLPGSGVHLVEIDLLRSRSTLMTNHRRTSVGSFDSPAKEKRSEECTSERCLLMCHAAVKTDSRAGWRITVVLSGQIPTHTGSCTKQKPGEAAATTRCSATTSAESAPT